MMYIEYNVDIPPFEISGFVEYDNFAWNYFYKMLIITTPHKWV